jgi:hypothetical protein
VRTAAAIVTALVAAASPAARADGKPLVGAWAMALDPSTVLVLKADGTGSFGGEPIRWQLLPGDRLALTDASGQTDLNGVRVETDALVLVGAGGATVQFRRVGGRPRPPASAKGGAAKPAPHADRAPGAAQGAGGGSAADRQLRDLLLSSAWCSFSYRATPGGGGSGDHTSSSRVVFRPDGTGARGSSTETRSTGAGGQYAGARSGGEDFRWQVRGGRLLVDSGAGLQDVNLTGTRNSSGYPILSAGGVEYMMCR